MRSSSKLRLRSCTKLWLQLVPSGKRHTNKRIGDSTLGARIPQKAAKKFAAFFIALSILSASNLQ